MSEKQIDYALTTKGRIKDRLSISESNFDTLLDRLIAAVTDIIESTCNRRFLRTTYTNDVYSVYNANQKVFALNQVPIISVSSAQYRFGLKSNPNWTDFNIDDWEIVGDGKSGLIRIWGAYGNPYSLNAINSLRFTYIAGYLINFDNAGDITKHNLPYDLSDLAERLVTKLFKRREHEGKSSETFQAGTVQWKELIDPFDQSIMDGYKRLPVFI